MCDRDVGNKAGVDNKQSDRLASSRVDISGEEVAARGSRGGRTDDPFPARGGRTDDPFPARGSRGGRTDDPIPARGSRTGGTVAGSADIDKGAGLPGVDLRGDRLDGVYQEGLVGPSVWHRSLDGTELAAIREGFGVTQALFAAQCGHSQQFQMQIERPGIHEISTSKAKDIINAISFYK